MAERQHVLKCTFPVLPFMILLLKQEEIIRII